MRPTLLILALCALFALAGCSKKAVTGKSGSPTSADKSLGGAPDPARARALLEQGKEHYKRDGEDQQAADAFQKAISLDPTLAEAHFRLGLAYDALGKDKEAEAAYKKAVETYKKYIAGNTKDAEAYYNLGQAYAGLHLYGEAAREYRQATHLKPDDTDIYYDLGKALMHLAQYDDAAGAFQKAIDIDAENYRARDALDEAREGAKRIKTGKKYSEDQLKKKQDEEQKKQQGTGAAGSVPTKSRKPW